MAQSSREAGRSQKKGGDVNVSVPPLQLSPYLLVVSAPYTLGGAVGASMAANDPIVAREHAQEKYLLMKLSLMPTWSCIENRKEN